MADDQGVDVEVEVGGWEHECCVLRPGRTPQPVLRVPSGLALRGSDPDDGHLETFKIGKPLPRSDAFLVVVRPSR